MREYSTKIALIKNGRGVYSLDTSIGCNTGMINTKGGCYHDCYAAKSAKLYGYDFSKTVYRYFVNEYHRRFILNQINKVPLDFIRIGTSGDPSENWEHSVTVIKQIDTCNKEIIVITKHWKLLSEDQLLYFAKINICVNTSVSALDDIEIITRCVNEYHRLKIYCKSVLRIVSCDFNLNNEIGHRLYKLQRVLFQNENIIDTVFRVGKNNPYVKDGVINVSKSKFLGKNALISKYNKKTYLGKCSTCKEMCGVNLKVEDQLFPKKRGITKQLSLI